MTPGNGDKTIADEMLILLGTIKNQGEENAKKLDKVDIKVDVVTAQSIRTETAAAAAHRRLDEIKPIVDRHERVLAEGHGAYKGASKVFHIGWILACAILSGIATLAGIFWF